MPIRFICLANSYKTGGRCIAGIELDDNGNPIIVGGSPKWIRPIANTNHGQVPNEIAEPFQLLDIIQTEIIVNQPDLHQVENVTFTEGNFQKIGEFNKGNLVVLCSNDINIFGNNRSAVHPDKIGDLHYSLILIEINQFTLTLNRDEERLHPQVRMTFQYHNRTYNLPITDPKFYSHEDFINNSQELSHFDTIYLCISLGGEYNGWYNKLIAGIIY